jgi:peptide/nickel transport system permease protein
MTVIPTRSSHRRAFRPGVIQLPGLRRLPAMLVIGLVALIAAMAVAGSLLAPQDPSAQNLFDVSQPASSAHQLGTDQLGRDVLSRTIDGTRSAVAGPLVIALVTMLGGSVLGVLAGYLGGRVDALTMRWVDFMYALPSLLITLVVVGVVGGGYWLAVALLAVLIVPYDTRLIRSAVLQQRGLPYVEAARTLGVRRRRIMTRHIYPNVLGVAIPNSCLNFAAALSSLASLSFLGIGAAPGSTSWGRMVAENSATMFQNPMATLAPALMIVLTAALVSYLGDLIHERMTDRGGGLS